MTLHFINTKNFTFQNEKRVFRWKKPRLAWQILVIILLEKFHMQSNNTASCSEYWYIPIFLVFCCSLCIRVVLNVEFPNHFMDIAICTKCIFPILPGSALQLKSTSCVKLFSKVIIRRMQVGDLGQWDEQKWALSFVISAFVLASPTVGDCCRT